MLEASLAHVIKLLCHFQSFMALLQRPLSNGVNPREQLGGLSRIHNIKAINGGFAVPQSVGAILNTGAAPTTIVVILQKLGPDNVQRNCAVVSDFALIDECKM